MDLSELLIEAVLRRKAWVMFTESDGACVVQMSEPASGCTQVTVEAPTMTEALSEALAASAAAVEAWDGRWSGVQPIDLRPRRSDDLLPRRSDDLLPF